MPELPDVTIYVEGLGERLVGQPLLRARISSPFLLRTFDPPLEATFGAAVQGVSRLGKRIVLALAGERYLVFHLMIAGRFRWAKAGARPPGKIGLAAFDFANGTLLLTEASQKKRASLHVVAGQASLDAFRPSGPEPLDATAEQFSAAIRRENHTLKRALSDPRVLSGVGNAYSDEILHAARLSPLKRTKTLSDPETARLRQATRDTLARWIGVLREQFRGRFPGPGEITAFRAGFAVHGRFNQPCPDCGTKVQRIRYAENETNYCPACQTNGRILADRSLSRLLKDDWPRTLEDLEDAVIL